MIKSLINFHNRLSDKDFIWFPFTVLRPRPEVTISQPRVWLMTICFSSYGLLVLILKSLAFGSSPYPGLGQDYFLLFIGFFLWFQFVTAPLWNQRAQTIAVRKGKPHG
ncbi:MAG: hypothetical protein H6624_15150 [Bdellovibrionaceae bacterium]|nr:hypothetical protein [Bdellovibrionales bacterium]MCB9085682.1 hypothetical protein [Pseudobdellovibrionaceae bacterium]